MPGMTSKLGHLQKIGIDVIWLSPVYKTPNDDKDYDISDYCMIMYQFAATADFDTILETMYARGINLMMDLVVDHTPE